MEGDQLKLKIFKFYFLIVLNLILKKVFEDYDLDKSNAINSSELRDAFGSAGYHLNNHILNTLIYRYGSADKTITFDDFVLCAVKVKTMVKIFMEMDYGNTNKATFSMDEWVTKALYS